MLAKGRLRLCFIDRLRTHVFGEFSEKKILQLTDFLFDRYNWFDK